MPDGTPNEIYTLQDEAVEARVMTYGGVVVSLKTHDRHGKQDDVVLGFDSLDKYLASKSHFGALIGRYANRIAHGSFRLTDDYVATATNDVSLQLSKAGVRLAMILNQALRKPYRFREGDSANEPIGYFLSLATTALAMSLTSGSTPRTAQQAEQVTL